MNITLNKLTSTRIRLLTRKHIKPINHETPTHNANLPSSDAGDGHAQTSEVHHGDSNKDTTRLRSVLVLR